MNWMKNLCILTWIRGSWLLQHLICKYGYYYYWWMVLNVWYFWYREACRKECHTSCPILEMSFTFSVISSFFFLCEVYQSLNAPTVPDVMQGLIDRVRLNVIMSFFFRKKCFACLQWFCDNIACNFPLLYLKGKFCPLRQTSSHSGHMCIVLFWLSDSDLLQFSFLPSSASYCSTWSLKFLLSHGGSQAGCFGSIFCFCLLPFSYHFVSTSSIIFHFWFSMGLRYFHLLEKPPVTLLREIRYNHTFHSFLHLIPQTAGQEVSIHCLYAFSIFIQWFTLKLNRWVCFLVFTRLMTVALHGMHQASRVYSREGLYYNQNRMIVIFLAKINHAGATVDTIFKTVSSSKARK